MRIIGGKDYYDSARAFGHDDQVVFVRGQFSKTDLVPNQLPTFPNRIHHVAYDARFWRDHGLRASLEPQYVWIAGRRYSGVIACSAPKVPVKSTWDCKYLWKADQVREFAEQHKLKLDQNEYRWESPDRPNWIYEKDLDEWFKPHDATPFEMEYLISRRIVIAISEFSRNYKCERQWRYNCDGLSTLNFAKVVEPYQAFQDISMYVGGVLPRLAAPIVELDDVNVAKKHGFNKWSFRKQSDPFLGD